MAYRIVFAVTRPVKRSAAAAACITIESLAATKVQDRDLLTVTVHAAGAPGSNSQIFSRPAPLPFTEIDASDVDGRGASAPAVAS